MTKKLKLFNGGDWSSRGGHLYVAAYSQQDAVNLMNLAYRRMRGYPDDADQGSTTLNTLQVYWSKGCWGNRMEGITPERGVWWTENDWGPKCKEPPRRLV